MGTINDRNGMDLTETEDIKTRWQEYTGKKKKKIHRKKVKSLSRVWLFATLRTVACQASQSMEFSRQGCWNGLPFSSPGDLPNSGIKPGSPALQEDSLPSEPPGKHKKDPNDPDNHGVITHLKPDILEFEVKQALGSITTTKLVEVMEF